MHCSRQKWINKIYKSVTVILVVAFLCQNIAWAVPQDSYQKKISLQVAYSKEYLAPQSQLDSALIDQFRQAQDGLGQSTGLLVNTAAFDDAATRLAGYGSQISPEALELAERTLGRLAGRTLEAEAVTFTTRTPAIIVVFAIIAAIALSYWPYIAPFIAQYIIAILIFTAVTPFIFVGIALLIEWFSEQPEEDTLGRRLAFKRTAWGFAAINIALNLWDIFREKQIVDLRRKKLKYTIREDEKYILTGKQKEVAEEEGSLRKRLKKKVTDYFQQEIKVMDKSKETGRLYAKSFVDCFQKRGYLSGIPGERQSFYAAKYKAQGDRTFLNYGEFLLKKYVPASLKAVVKHEGKHREDTRTSKWYAGLATDAQVLWSLLIHRLGKPVEGKHHGREAKMKPTDIFNDDGSWSNFPGEEFPFYQYALLNLYANAYFETAAYIVEYKSLSEYLGIKDLKEYISDFRVNRDCEIFISRIAQVPEGSYPPGFNQEQFSAYLLKRHVFNLYNTFFQGAVNPQTGAIDERQVRRNYIRQMVPRLGSGSEKLSLQMFSLVLLKDKKITSEDWEKFQEQFRIGSIDESVLPDRLLDWLETGIYCHGVFSAGSIEERRRPGVSKGSKQAVSEMVKQLVPEPGKKQAFIAGLLEETGLLSLFALFSKKLTFKSKARRFLAGVESLLGSSLPLIVYLLGFGAGLFSLNGTVIFLIVLVNNVTFISLHDNKDWQELWMRILARSWFSFIAVIPLVIALLVPIGNILILVSLAGVGLIVAIVMHYAWDSAFSENEDLFQEIEIELTEWKRIDSINIMVPGMSVWQDQEGKKMQVRQQGTDSEIPILELDISEEGIAQFNEDSDQKELLDQLAAVGESLGQTLLYQQMAVFYEGVRRFYSAESAIFKNVLEQRSWGARAQQFLQEQADSARGEGRIAWPTVEPDFETILEGADQEVIDIFNNGNIDKLQFETKNPSRVAEIIYLFVAHSEKRILSSSEFILICLNCERLAWKGVRKVTKDNIMELFLGVQDVVFGVLENREFRYQKGLLERKAKLVDSVRRIRERARKTLKGDDAAEDTGWVGEKIDDLVLLLQRYKKEGYLQVEKVSGSELKELQLIRNEDVCLVDLVDDDSDGVALKGMLVYDGEYEGGSWFFSLESTVLPSMEQASTLRRIDFTKTPLIGDYYVIRFYPGYHEKVQIESMNMLGSVAALNAIAGMSATSEYAPLTVSSGGIKGITEGKGKTPALSVLVKEFVRQRFAEASNVSIAAFASLLEETGLLAILGFSKEITKATGKKPWLAVICSILGSSMPLLLFCSSLSLLVTSWTITSFGIAVFFGLVLLVVNVFSFRYLHKSTDGEVDSARVVFSFIAAAFFIIGVFDPIINLLLGLLAVLVAHFVWDLFALPQQPRRVKGKEKVPLPADKLRMLDEEAAEAEKPLTRKQRKAAGAILAEIRQLRITNTEPDMVITVSAFHEYMELEPETHEYLDPSSVLGVIASMEDRHAIPGNRKNVLQYVLDALYEDVSRFYREIDAPRANMHPFVLAAELGGVFGERCQPQAISSAQIAILVGALYQCVTAADTSEAQEAALNLSIKIALDVLDYHSNLIVEQDRQQLLITIETFFSWVKGAGRKIAVDHIHRYDEVTRGYKDIVVELPGHPPSVEYDGNPITVVLSPRRKEKVPTKHGAFRLRIVKPEDLDEDHPLNEIVPDGVEFVIYNMDDPSQCIGLPDGTHNGPVIGRHYADRFAGLPGIKDVSRRHVSICRTGNTIRVNDLGSSNGTRVFYSPTVVRQKVIKKIADLLKMELQTVKQIMNIEPKAEQEQIEAVRKMLLADNQISDGELELIVAAAERIVGVRTELAELVGSDVDRVEESLLIFMLRAMLNKLERKTYPRFVVELVKLTRPYAVKKGLDPARLEEFIKELYWTNGYYYGATGVQPRQGYAVRLTWLRDNFGDAGIDACLMALNRYQYIKAYAMDKYRLSELEDSEEIWSIDGPIAKTLIRYYEMRKAGEVGGAIVMAIAVYAVARDEVLATVAVSQRESVAEKIDSLLDRKGINGELLIPYLDQHDEDIEAGVAEQLKAANVAVPEAGPLEMDPTVPMLSAV